MTIKKDKKKMTERIVNHALEIIFLLTGEEYIIMKKNAPQSIHLLTGEVHIKSGDAAVYFSTEEWEYIERHKESYKDVMMETLGTLGIPTSKTSGKIVTEVASDKEQKEESFAIRRLDTEVQEIKENSGPGRSKPGFEPDIDQSEARAVICVEDKEQEICINDDSGEINEIVSDIENKGEPYAERSLEDTVQIICVNADSGESSSVDILEESQPATCISDDDTGKINPEVARDVEEKVKQCAVRCLDDEDEEVCVSSGSGGSWSRRMSGEYQTAVCISHELAKYESGVFHGLQAENAKGNLALWKRGDTIFAPQPYQCKENALAVNEKFDYSSEEEAIKHNNREKTICAKGPSGKSPCEYYTLAEDTPFNCDDVSNSYMSAQQIGHNDDTVYECTEGEKHFSYDSIFSRHQLIHTKEEPCASTDFDKCFTDNPHEVTHYMDSSGEKPFSCNDCGQCFTRRSSLLRHSKFHSGDKPYTCLVCGKCFSNKSHLVAHRRIHEGEKPYACPECGKCFANRSYLSVHKRTHTGEKPYSCPECGKRFTAMQSVVRHRRSHTGEKPYACGECGKRFTRRSCLNRHNRSHMRVKPFPCAECGQCFTNKALLDAHKITHTGVKLYSCTECGKCFTQMAALIVHHRSHIEENP
ncbi:zinc finger protein 2 homolog isoform X1 [Xenopus tropicalis]|uniref:Zinc finger protein 2 homolog isoform X1 n=1 Tax=Xenopus tropicalis TaxID=8364 RepID=A0A6I8Q657_XENTR|nr:zinc finger protein 2 homolog isoform X1 [Xenopus tropicalis]XP_031747439.1 zinc finger protein 2 homolog isoform X1 [Xenopus tropicalis]|eukprot:XP_002936841.1 PREDICTED: zinc finger protein 2 homolog [Xenopus tropicalis]